MLPAERLQAERLQTERQQQLECKYRALYLSNESKSPPYWDQRRTLAPPPYKEGGVWHPIATAGLQIADPSVDALPTLLCHASKDDQRCPLGDRAQLPAWVDWAAVERGQKLWMEHFLRAGMALGMALLAGLSIARFAEILMYSGYGDTPIAALKRYRVTFFHWVDWFRYALDDPASEARKSIFAVRRVHSFARKMVMRADWWQLEEEKSARHEGLPSVPRGGKKNGGQQACPTLLVEENSKSDDSDTSSFNVPDCGRASTTASQADIWEASSIGIPLSQFDLAEVQLAFSGICIAIFEDELASGAKALPPQDKADMVHLWRLIGYLLGIQDEYNVCESVEKMDELVEEFAVFAPMRILTARPCSVKLRDAAIQGFGQWAGLGSGYYKGLFMLACNSPRLRGRLNLVDAENGEQSINKQPSSRQTEDVAFSDFTALAPYAPRALPWMKYFASIYVKWLCRLPVRSEKIWEIRDLEHNSPAAGWRIVERHTRCCHVFDFVFWNRLGLLEVLKIGLAACGVRAGSTVALVSAGLLAAGAYCWCGAWNPRQPFRTLTAGTCTVVVAGLCAAAAMLALAGEAVKKAVSGGTWA